MAEEIINNTATVFGEKGEDPALLEAMAKAGVWYGRRKSKTNPRMRSFLFGTRNGVEIFDLPQTHDRIVRAGKFLQSVVAQGGTILVVGTTPASQELAQGLANRFGFPWVTERWLGGTLTNFKTISLRLQHFLKLRADRDAGRLEKYTKKERSDFDKEIRRLTTLFGGLEKLTELPKAVLVINAGAHETAIREALRLKIPVVTIMNSDSNPEKVPYAIPANDSARASIAWILEALTPYLEAGKAEAASKVVKEVGVKK